MTSFISVLHRDVTTDSEAHLLSCPVGGLFLGVKQITDFSVAQILIFDELPITRLYFHEMELRHGEHMLFTFSI